MCQSLRGGLFVPSFCHLAHGGAGDIAFQCSGLRVGLQGLQSAYWGMTLSLAFLVETPCSRTRTPMPRSRRLCRFVAKFCDQARPSGKVNFEKSSLGMSKDSKTTNLWSLKVWEAGTTEGSVLERAECSEARQEETKIYWRLC